MLSSYLNTNYYYILIYSSSMGVDLLILMGGTRCIC